MPKQFSSTTPEKLHHCKNSPLCSYSTKMQSKLTTLLLLSVRLLVQIRLYQKFLNLDSTPLPTQPIVSLGSEPSNQQDSEVVTFSLSSSWHPFPPYIADVVTTPYDLDLLEGLSRLRLSVPSHWHPITQAPPSTQQSCTLCSSTVCSE